jgi:hypothetical protein
MELIGALVLAVLALLGAAISNQISDEYKSWTPWIVERLIRRSVRRLPENLKERFDEEWRSHIAEIPGETGKLIMAAGFLTASRRMALAPEQEISVIKRAVDVFVSLTFLITFIPVWVPILFLIKKEGSGPIFFKIERQRSNGTKYNEYSFSTFKFLDKPESDVRVTKIGKLLRRTEFHHFPRFINFLCGDISLFTSPPNLLIKHIGIFTKFFKNTPR